MSALPIIIFTLAWGCCGALAEPSDTALPNAQRVKAGAESGQALPTEQKLQELRENKELKKLAEDVLFSATEEKHKENPKMLILYLEEGLGATREERLAAFRELYALGESPEKRDEYDYTGLGYACALGRLDEVKKLLELKPDLQVGAYDPSVKRDCCCGGSRNYMPGYVQVALENGHKDLARYLLGLKAAPVGAGVCLKNDDISMLKELLAAGGSVHEAEQHPGLPCTMDARSPEMIRFLLANGCRKMRPLECLYRIRERHVDDAGAEAAQRDIFLKAGCLTPHDVEEFDKGGLAHCKGGWEQMSLPAAGLDDRDEDYGWSWVKRDEAWNICTALAGTSLSAQDAAVLHLLRLIPTPRVVRVEHLDLTCVSSMNTALCIVGDERFAAQVARLTAAQRAHVLFVLESTYPTREEMKEWEENYPLTMQTLRK